MDRLLCCARTLGCADSVRQKYIAAESGSRLTADTHPHERLLVPYSSVPASLSRCRHGRWATRPQSPADWVWWSSRRWGGERVEEAGRDVDRPSVGGGTRVTREEGFFFFQAEDGIRDYKVTGVQTCALPI